VAKKTKKKAGRPLEPRPKGIDRVLAALSPEMLRAVERETWRLRKQKARKEECQD
jgi:hypothetical protein